MFQNALHDHNIPEENKEFEEVGTKIKRFQPSYYSTSSLNMQHHHPNKSMDLERNPINFFYSGQMGSTEKKFDQNQFVTEPTLTTIDKPQDRSTSLGKFFF